MTPIGLDHIEFLGDAVAEIATEKAGIIKPGADRDPRRPARRGGRAAVAPGVDVDASVAREGLEFGVLDRQVAVGGQLLTLQGSAGVYDEIFLPLHGAHQAQNAACALAAVEAFFGAGAPSGPLDIDIVRAAFAAVRSPGRLETIRTAPTVLRRCGAQPARA